MVIRIVKNITVTLFALGFLLTTNAVSGVNAPAGLKEKFSKACGVPINSSELKDVVDLIVKSGGEWPQLMPFVTNVFCKGRPLPPDYNEILEDLSPENKYRSTNNFYYIIDSPVGFEIYVINNRSLGVRFNVNKNISFIDRAKHIAPSIKIADKAKVNESRMIDYSNLKMPELLTSPNKSKAQNISCKNRNNSSDKDAINALYGMPWSALRGDHFSEYDKGNFFPIEGLFPIRCFDINYDNGDYVHYTRYAVSSANPIADKFNYEILWFDVNVAGEDKSFGLQSKVFKLADSEGNNPIVVQGVADFDNDGRSDVILDTRPYTARFFEVITFPSEGEIKRERVSGFPGH